MANFDVNEKCSPLQFGALMRKIPSNALRIIIYYFLNDFILIYMYLNGYENDIFDISMW